MKANVEYIPEGKYGCEYTSPMDPTAQWIIENQSFLQKQVFIAPMQLKEVT